METQIVKLTNDEINARVNGTNKFTKAEIGAYRPAIAAARKDKRNRLRNMSSHQQDAKIAELRENGFTVLHDVKVKSLKSGERVVVEFAKERETASSRAERLEKERDELRARLEALEGKGAARKTPLPAVVNA